MDGVRIIQKVILLVVLQISILNSLSCKEYALDKIMPIIDSEIEYDYYKMIDAQKDHPADINSINYSLEIMKAEKEFLKKCKTIQDDDSLIGVWRLVDKNGKNIKNHSFLFNEYILISKYINDIVLDNWGNRSVLYLGNNNRFYIYTKGIGIIRMIQIKDNKLFVYIIQNKEWILDSIHNDGEYIFKKINNATDKNELDMKNWFKKL